MSVLGNKISEFLLNTNNFKVVRGTVNKLFLDLVLKNVRIKIYFSLFHVDVDPTTCQTEKKTSDVSDVERKGKTFIQQ